MNLLLIPQTKLHFSAALVVVVVVAGGAGGAGVGGGTADAHL